MNADYLRAAIAKKGMTQAEVAQKIGISQNSFSKKINEKREFQLSEAKKLCKVLGVEDPRPIFLIRPSYLRNNKRGN